MKFVWLEGLLPHLLPYGALTQKSKIWWVLFFALFPLAYIGGVMLETVEESPAMMAGFEDRAASIKTAQEYARSKGFPVSGWSAYVIAETHDDLLAYYSDNSKGDPLVAAASHLVPGQEVQVVFRSPDLSHEFRTYLSLVGHVTGYDFGKSATVDNTNFSVSGTGITASTTTKSSDDGDTAAGDASDAEAEATARQALARNTALSGLIQLGKPQVSTDDADSARRDVSWEASPAGKPELTFTVKVGVRDAQVVAEHLEAKLDKKYRTKTPAFRSTLWSFYSLFLTFGAFYAVIRYAKRTLQKEVSHLRTLVVAALFAISYSTLVYSTGIDQIAARVGGLRFEKIGIFLYISAAAGFSLMGLLVGIGYGSGEGEVREAYPGKLTSLDALLAGRVFSRNVGASLLFGAAAAGWLLLFHQAGAYFLKADVLTTRGDVLTYTFSRLPWLTLLVGRQYDSLLIAVTGLLLPSALLMRRTMRRSRRFAWLVFFAAGSVLYDAAKYPNFEAAVLAMTVLTCALLMPFFAFDLLAAMVSLSALSFVEELTRLSAVFPSWDSLALSLASLAGLVVVTATWLALRGRSVDEEEVRPLYARNLAQRMSLQAEVQAAREAQLRLLPQAVPELAGVQFAACCLPARGVGGDFYDFFRLDEDRVGIFVAQGGEQGLASALCIALAKGVLMHLSLQPRSPTETIIDLEASIGELLEGGSAGRISFAYGVMDIRRSTLSYARMGSSPRFLVYREGSGIQTSAQLERVVPVAGRLKSAATIYEGSATARPGDFLIFFTKGMTTLRVKRFLRNEYQWLEALTPYLSRPQEPLQTSLTAAMSKHHSRTSDDLTAVVVRVMQAQPAENETRLQEVVA